MPSGNQHSDRAAFPDPIIYLPPLLLRNGSLGRSRTLFRCGALCSGSFLSLLRRLCSRLLVICDFRAI